MSKKQLVSQIWGVSEASANALEIREYQISTYPRYLGRYEITDVSTSLLLNHIHKFYPTICRLPFEQCCA